MSKKDIPVKVDNKTGTVIVDEDVEIDERTGEVIYKKKKKSRNDNKYDTYN